jgi:hypothetical protein
MKAEFLKLAGVKSEKAFYKKYPTEQAFFKAHPEAKKMIKKAQAGTVMSGMSSYLQGMQGVQNMPNMQNVIQGQTQSGGVNAGMFNGPQVDNSVSTINASQLANNQSGYAYPGGPNSNVEKGNSSGITKGLESLPGLGGDLMKGYNNLRAERRAKKEAQMWAKVTGVQAKASESTDIDSYRQYTDNMQRKRNAFMPEMTGEEFFPVYGVGTNVLARNGARLEDGGMVGGNPTEIQNTYGDGNSLYDNLEYEPLYDVDQVKSYRMGGYLPKAQVGAGVLSGASETMGGAAAGSRGIMGGASQTMGTSSTTPWGAIGQVGSGVANGATGNNAGGQIGGSVGGAVGSIFGPAGQAIGQIGGSLIGGLLDTNPRDMRKAQSKIKYNTDRMIKSQFGKANQSYLSSMGVAEDGINMNPQVIARFGNLDAQDFADYAHEDQLRSGGHLKAYREPSERAMQTYAMGGQLKTHWGGGAETMSHNPYMPGSGETVVFRGQSHTDSDGKGNTGIGITYGDNPVEVERGEPMFEMQSGGEINPETGEPENTGVVFGNMKLDKNMASKLNDPELMKIVNKYHGKKFKNVGIDYAKQEAKQNKIIDKNIKILDSFKVETSIDKAKLSALEKMIEGSMNKLKNIANEKITLANFQNSINEAKDELSEVIGQNLSAEDLAKGYVKLDKDPVTMNAKWGGDIIKKAQDGDKPRSFKSEREANAAGYYKGDDGKYRRKIKKFSTKESENKSADALGYIPAGQKQSASGLWGKVTPEQFEETKRANAWFDWTGFDPKDENDVKNYQMAFNARAKALGSSANINVDGDFGEQTVSARIDESKKAEPVQNEEELTAIVEEPTPTEIVEEKAKFPWLATLGNAAINYLRPTDQEELDPQQLLGEMYAMSNNNLEPVQAQSYNPQLRVPYDISYQDQLNEINAGQRATQRMVGYNPAAQANVAAQAYGAKSNVLAEQFRANQAMKDQVYTGNVNTLNDANKTNLAIFADQWDKQSQAKSIGKATTQAALNSISDKYAKNKLENRTLGVYENMYNYRFGKSGRAQNYNPLQFFDTEMDGSKSSARGRLAQGKEYTYDGNGNIVGVRASDKYSVTDSDLEAIGGIKGKNGISTKKNYKNSSVVRAFKNL